MASILHIVTRLDMGGSAQNTLLTCIGLAERYDVTLVYGLSHESRITELERATLADQIGLAKRKGVRTVTAPALVRKLDPFRDVRAFLLLWRLIRAERPAIVHTHTSKAGVLGRLAAKIAGVPTIIHTPHGHVFSGHFGPILSKLFLLTEVLFDRITDSQVALTEGEKKDYIGLSVCREDKIAVIHSGVDVDRYANVDIDVGKKKEALGLEPKALVVGTIGWLLAIKGPADLLEAMGDVWARYPDVQLVFAGKGDLEESLRARALEMGAAEKTLFLGWRDDIPEIIQVLDVLALPSRNEGMGRVLVEAMAAGKPIVASNVGGIPDLVKHGQNGFLVEPGNTQEWSHGIEKLLGSREMRQEMGQKGRAMSRDFSVERMLEKIDELYSSYLSE